MSEGLRGRTILVFLYLAFCVIYLLPSVAKLPENWPLFKKPLNYGLDIQGGAHLVYGVDIPGVLAERNARLARSLTAELSEKKIEAKVTVPQGQDRVEIALANPADSSKVTDHLKEVHSTTLQVVGSPGTELEFAL